MLALQEVQGSPAANLAEPRWRLASQCAAAAGMRDPTLALRPCRLRPLYMRAGLPSDSSALLWRLSIQSRGGASLPLAQLPLTSEREARLCRAARSSAWRIGSSDMGLRVRVLHPRDAQVRFGATPVGVLCST